MKKIYSTLAVAMAFAMSASAAGLNGFTKPAHEMLNGEIQFVEPTTSAQVFLKNTEKSRMKSVSASLLGGTYAWGAYVPLSSHGGWQYGNLDIEVSSDGTSATVSGLTMYGALSATVDLSKGTVTIPQQELGVYTYDTSLTVRFSRYEWNEAGTNVVESADPIVLTWNQGYLELDSDYTLIAEDVIDASGNLQGFFTLAYYNTIARYSDTLDNTGWVDCGTASFTDAWLGDGVTSWNVEVQKSTTTEGLIRLVDPYSVKGNCPSELSKYNESKIEGSVEFDIANRDCVLGVPNVMSPSGFADSSDGQYFLYSTDGYDFYTQEDDDAYTREDLVDAYGAGYTGSVVGNTLSLNNLSLGFGYYLYTMYNYQWKDSETGLVLDLTSVVELPDAALTAVTEIEASDVQAPVQYFNMQGVQVASPEKGQLVIKKQGSKATKVIM